MDTEILLERISGLQAEVSELKRLMQNQQKTVYTSSDLETLFSVSSQTLRAWRHKGFLGFTQVGSTVLFSQDDVNKFLSQNHRSSLSECSSKA